MSEQSKFTCAAVCGDGWDYVAWATNNGLYRDRVTVEQIDEWLDTPEAQALPDWAFDVINAIMNNASNVTEFSQN